MLVQSPEETDDIWVLPALPRQLPSGLLSGVRLRGRWAVDIEWKDTVLSHVVLTADIGGARRVHYQNNTKDVELQAGQSVKLFGAHLSTS
jgi:alpha-L-fucosidase 2